jgi:hypothetical protein
MSLDKHAAERRRFAHLLGTDGDHGSGLPIGGRDADDESEEDDDDDRDLERSSDGDATKSRARSGTRPMPSRPLRSL